MATPSALEYFGGKSERSPTGTGKWIADKLPKNLDVCYVEPFFGMGGVLLQRPPSKHEIVNDLNKRLVNWWRVVRDEWDELGQLLEFTPNARDEYRWAIDNLDNTELANAKRALAYHICLWLGIMPGDGRFQQSNWGIRYKTTNGPRKRWYTNDVKMLSERMKHVQIENRDAIELLTRLEKEKNTVMYVDPPYTTDKVMRLDITVYGIYDFDGDALKDTLLRQTGKVAILWIQ